MNLLLFTSKFPFKGGETFLETEIFYLADQFDHITIYPLVTGTELSIQLPTNVTVADFKIENKVSLRGIVKRHLGLLVQWFLYEFIFSKHRFKYITQFKWNLYRLVGHVDCAERLQKQLKVNSSDTVFYTYWFNEWGSILAILKKKYMDFTLVSRVHLYDFEEEFVARKYLPFRNMEMKYFDAICPISEYGRKYLEKSKPGQKFDVFKLGVNVSSELISIPVEDTFRIVSCSLLEWYKRPLMLVDLVSNLKSDIEWHHFGDGEMKNQFLKAASELPSNIKFIFHGHKPNSEIYKFYQNNHVSLFLNVSEFEGIPVAIMEAISFGVPVVACNVCGVPEIVNESTGILLDKFFNPKDSAESIDRFLEDKKSDLQYRKDVQQFCLKYYNASVNYPAFNNYLKKLINRNSVLENGSQIMSHQKSKLYLFTNNYPYKGYEYFIDNEIGYLSEAFDEVIVMPYPGNSNTEMYFKLPPNVHVNTIQTDNTSSIKYLVFKNIFQFIYWWVYELIASKHRIKYFTEIGWNLNRLIEIIQLSESLKNEKIPENAILYSYWFNEWADALAWSKGSWLKNNFVSRAHGYDFDEAQIPRGYNAFRQVVFSKIKKVFQISEYGKSYMKKQGLNDSKIEVIRLGVSDHGMGVIPQEKYIIVTCSNLYPVKRLELIPEILNYITVPFKWVHFGGGNYEEEMLSQIRKKMSSDYFEYRGITPNADILDFYAKSGVDVVMNVSKLEGIPVSLMEAISFGIPITGCNTCGVPEIANENTGLLYDVQFDPKEAAMQLQSLLLQKSRNLEFRQGVREYYIKNYKAEDKFPRFIHQLKKQAV